MTVVKPTTPEELSEAIKSAKGPFEVVGNGSKRSLGRRVQADTILDLSSFSGVIAYEPEELIIEAGAATPLAEIEKLLATKNQMLAFEPPRLRVLLGDDAGTVGGTLACNLSGSRRLTAGAARDHVLGVQGVDGRGTIFKGGGRVVKNVTGYDMPKLLAGSYGTLAAVTSVVFKVLPKPETELTLLVPARDPAEAIAIISQAMASPHGVSCAAFTPDRGVCLRLEGIPSSVDARCAELLRLFTNRVEILREAPSLSQWQVIRDLSLLTRRKEPIIWRVSTAPSQSAVLAGKLSEISQITYLIDWAGGLVWIGTADASLNVRDHLMSGHAMLFRAPDEMKQRIPVFHPQSPALAALTRRVKDAFDPDRKLNPGRMYEGV